MPTVPINANQLSDRIRVFLANEQSTYAINERQLLEAATAVVRDSTFSSAMISLAVVDDAAMQELNRRHLEHDYPTDVLSFVLEENGDHLEGEVIVSCDTATVMAEEHGWPSAAELLLYVIHGTLHLVGYRDKSLSEIAEMRAAEEKYMLKFGYTQATNDSGRGDSVR